MNALPRSPPSAGRASVLVALQVEVNEEADVPFFNPYKLRHSHATALRAEGMDLADVQQLLGHKSPKTTERYAAVAPHKLAQASEMLAKSWPRGKAAWQAAQQKENKAG